MKEFVLSHKKELFIGAAALAAVAVIAALICTAMLRSPVEEVPKGRVHDAGVFGDEIIVYDSTNGEIVIDGSDTETVWAGLSVAGATGSQLVSDPEQIWLGNAYAGNHTPIEAVQMEDGSIGVLTIQELGLSVNVFEGPDQMEDMDKGVAHFPHTSAWDGNIGLSAHNVNFDGSDGFFKNLHLLAEGDAIQYKTTQGERTYTVQSVQEISADDWSQLGHTDENRLTLITCISGKPAKRLCIQAVEQENS